METNFVDKKKFISLIALLGIIVGITKAVTDRNILTKKFPKIPTREIIILLDYQKQEEIKKTLYATISQESYIQPPNPRGIGAMTITFLIALYQKAAPILVQSTLIENILKHKQIVKDFLTKNLQILSEKYSQYTRFQNYNNLKQFKENCCYIQNRYQEFINELNKIKTKDSKNIQKFLLKITSDKRFNIKYAPNGLQHLDKHFTKKLMFFEMIIYTLCYLAPINKSDWIIKKVNNDLYLFLPKKYINEMGIKEEALSFKKSKKNTVNLLEQSIGLKVNHLKDIDSFVQEFSQNKKNKNSKTLSESLKKLFVLNTDKDENNENIKQKQIWSIYATGHGIPKAPINELLSQLNSLEKLYSKKISNKKYKKCLEVKQKQDLYSYQYHLNSCKKHHIFQRSYLNLRKIKNEIKKLKSRINKINKLHEGTILSLTKEEFQKLLLFFNDKIKTAFLYYTSCYSGGSVAIEAYTKTNGKQLILNYHVASGTLAENMSLQEMPLFKLPPYNQIKINKKIIIQGITSKDINLDDNTLKLQTTLQYEKFFKSLRQGLHLDPKNLPTVIFNLHPYTQTPNGKLKTQCIGNIPLIRFAGEDHFTVIPHDNSFVKIDKEFVKNCNKKIKLNPETAALLYTEYIPTPISFSRKKNKRVSPFISMIPGLAVHTFEQISAPRLSLTDVMKSFLFFPELSASKIFWIKKLKCSRKGKLANYVKAKYNKPISELNDVIIMRNICNSDILHSKLSNQPPVNTCAYVSLPGLNKSFKISWKGFEPNEYDVKDFYENEHKKEVIAYKPDIKDLISTNKKTNIKA